METGKKMALLVGLNYPNTRYELHGCQNDVLAMHKVLLARFGFSPENVELLMDRPGSPIMPTGANIMSALNKMVDRAQEGDILFFHYSGHGTLVKSQRFKEEAIVPSDFNLITSVDFRQLINRVPGGATFTILSDSCHSGRLIDQEKEQIGPSSTALKDTPIGTISIPQKPKAISPESMLQYFTSLTGKISTDIGEHLVELFGPDASLMFRGGPKIDTPVRDDGGILLSGCQTNETSADVQFTGNMCGAFSNAVQMVLRENPKRDLSNREMVVMARKVLASQFFQNQHPCLYCSDPNADAVFLGGSKVTS